ncbi:ankyrin [Daedalea quercina L-15889]|uniref:Ankyrin n=1 Tax=Daedalea quercina L-15889 TaxID=1314783 RepID=A0A165T9Y4_9APHY|nr:ankyrin [Daedalea quercina L-15889]
MPLLDAAARGDVEAVRTAIQSGADVNASDPEGWTSVACAIAGRSWENIDVLDASFKLEERVEILQMLLDQGDISLFTLNTPVRGVSPLCLAAWLDILQMVRLLLEGSHGMIPVNGMDDFGATPLMYAARDHRIEIVEYLLANGARPDYRDVNHRSSIQHALRHPHILWHCEHALRRYRIQEDMFINTRHLTILPPPFIDRLIATPVMPKIFCLPMHSLRNYAQRAEFLVQAVIVGDVGRLHSMLFSHAQCLTLGSDQTPPQYLVNLPDATGWCPIHYCVSTEHPSVEVLDILYRAGADVSLYTTAGHETPLHCLAYKARQPKTPDQAASLRSFILHLVRDLHAPLSARDHNMDTCLHVAAEHGRSTDVVTALLAADTSGTLRELRNSRGLTALDVARPEMRAAFGVDNENTRPVSSASMRTLRPSTSESVKSMPPLIRTAERMLRHNSPLPANVPLPDADWVALSNSVLDCLQTVPVDMTGAASFDMTARAGMLQEIAVMRDTLLASLRLRVRETIEELHDARRAFQQAYGLYRDVRKASDRLLGEGALNVRLSQDSDHARRRTTDSDDSGVTAVSEASYVLVNRKARSMSDLRASQQANAHKIPVPTIPRLPQTSPRRSTTVKYHPDASTRTGTPDTLGRSGRSGSCTIPIGNPREPPRKRSTTLGDSNLGRFPTSSSKVSLTNGTARVKAWLINKIRPGTPRAEAIPEGRLSGSSQVDRDDGSSSESDDTDSESDKIRCVLACQKGLAAARRDLHRIEGRLEAAEQFLVNANRAISKVELRINRAISARKVSLEADRLQPAPEGATFAFQSSLDFPSSNPAAGDGDGIPLSRPSSSRPTSRPRSRSDISVMSAMSASSTLVEGEDEDIRNLRRLLTRKVASLMDGADEEVDRAVVWLRIVKEVLIGLGKRT